VSLRTFLAAYGHLEDDGAAVSSTPRRTREAWFHVVDVFKADAKDIRRVCILRRGRVQHVDVDPSVSGNMRPPSQVLVRYSDVARDGRLVDAKVVDVHG